MFSQLCGLNVHSNRPIPGLEPLKAEVGAVDLVVRLAEGHPWSPEEDGDHADSTFMRWDEQGEPLLTVTRALDGRFFRLAYSDGTDFTIDEQGRNIWASWSEPYSIEDAATYLLGPVLGFTLRRRGCVSLHASAFALDSQTTVALAGPPGAGKSTTITAFARRGYSVLTDDILPLEEIEGTFHGLPTYPRLRLWGDSVEKFYGSEEALPPLTPNWEKRALDLKAEGHIFVDRPLRLSAIYFLRFIAEGDSRIVPLQGPMALMALVHNTYVNYLLDSQMRAQEFEVLTELLGRVPLRALEMPQPGPRPDDLCGLILQDLATLSDAA